MSTKCYMYESVKLICCLTFWSWSTSFIRKRRKKKEKKGIENWTGQSDGLANGLTDAEKNFRQLRWNWQWTRFIPNLFFFRNRYILMLYHFVKLKVTEIVTKKHNIAYLKLTLFILNGSNPLSYLSVLI